MRLSLLFSFVVIGCNSDKNITINTPAPTVLIQEPADGSNLQQGDMRTMRGYIQDNTYEDQLNEMEVFWTVNGDVVCEDSTVDLGGNTTCEYTFLDTGETEINLRVVSPGAITGESTNIVFVEENANPTAEILKPDGTVNYYSDYPIAFEGRLSDVETAVTDLRGYWRFQEADDPDTDEDESQSAGTSSEIDISAQPNEEGIVSGQDYLPQGWWEIILEAEESENRIGLDQTTIYVRGENTRPVCQISNPTDTMIIGNNDILELSGTAEDPDIDESELYLTWSSNIDGVLSEGFVNSDGTFSVGVTALTVGPHTVSLLVEDEVGATCTDSVDIIIAAGPSVQIVLPSEECSDTCSSSSDGVCDDGEHPSVDAACEYGTDCSDCGVRNPVFNSGARVDFQGLVSDNQDSPEDLTLTWRSSIDDVFSTQTAASNGVAVAFSYALTPGASHVIELEAIDTDGFDSVDQVTIDINDLPTAPVIEITPDPSTSSDDLNVNITTPSTDSEGYPITYSYAWERNGQPTSQTSATLLYTETTRGEVWTVTVTPNDGMGDGTTISMDATITNSAPYITASVLSHTSAYETDTITCSPSGTYDEDGDSVSHSYSWEVNGSAVSTSSTIDGTLFDRGDVLQCFITPSDGLSDGTGATVASVTLTISNSIPVLTAANVTPQTAYEATTLSCDHPNATDADPGDVSGLYYTYNWIVNGTALNLNQSTLDGANFDKNQDVYCTIVPEDGTDSGTMVTSNTITIQNTAPVLGSVDLTPDPAYEASTMVCTPTSGSYTDDDNDTITFSYEWKVNNVTLTSTGPFLTGSDFDEGDSVYCVATPRDGTDDGIPIDSNSIVIQNSIPVITQPSITPDPADVTDTLTCNPGTTSDNDAGDTVTIAYEWTINGTASSTTLDSLSSAEFQRGDTVICITTPNDGSEDGAPVSSAPLVIQNALPSITSVQLTPTTSYEADTLTCTPAGWNDPDGDTPGYLYSWTVGGTVVQSATTNTLTGAFFDRDQQVFCTVTPDDGLDTGTPVDSNTITIQNTPPVLDSVSLGPDPAYENSTLACSTGTTSDDDGDNISFGQSSSYEWLVNGGVIAASGSTLTGSDFNKGDSVQCIVTPYDGTDFGSSVPSGTLTIQNTAPTISGASLSPAGADVTDQLICTAGTTNDIDPADSVSTTYQWTVNNQTISTTTDTLSSPDFSRGDVVRCIVTPTDGSLSGNAATSNSITIQNAEPTISSVDLSPTSAYEASTLSCAPQNGVDPDGDTVNYLYQWYVNSSVISVASSSLTGSYFNRGDSVYCEATPTDGSTTGSTVQSNLVTVLNTPPTANVPSLSPTTAYESSTFTCTWNGGSDDDPQDSVSNSFGWKINGQVISATSSTLTGSSFNKGDAVTCFVTPTDGSDSGTPVDSSGVVVSNTAPSFTNVSISPTTPYADENIISTVVGWQDDDGDAENYLYQWYNQNGPISGGTNASLGTTVTLKGDVIYLEVTPFDGTDSGATKTSNLATVQNSPPTAPVVEVQPIDAEPEDNLECVILTPSSDADFDNITYTYTWYLGGTIMTGFTSNIVSYTQTQHNDIWTCSVTPNDGSVNGNAGSDSQTVADQTAPDAPVLDAIDQYRNTGTITITGTAESGSVITLFKDCSSGLTTSTTTASNTGVFSLIISIASGDDCDYYAKATDAYGNISDPSNSLFSEYCAVVDTYEISTTYDGNTCLDSVDAWTVLGDTNSSDINISGNVLDPADEDWYVIDTSQTQISSGINLYNFQADLTAGASFYDMVVYRGDCTPGSLQCSSTGAGYDSYDFYAEDSGSNFFVPSDSRYCDNGVPYNRCDDLSSIYYIKVYRTDGNIDCEHYTLTLSNGY